MNLLVVVAIFAGLFAMFSLFRGVNSMAHGGPADLAHSTGLMRDRVISHAIAFGALLLAAVLGFLR